MWSGRFWAWGRAKGTWGMGYSQAEDFSHPNLYIQVLGHHHRLLAVVDHKGPHPYLHLGKPSSHR